MKGINYIPPETGLVKLWENDNPTATFAGQTITLTKDGIPQASGGVAEPYTNYDLIVVIYRYFSAGLDSRTLVPIPGGTYYLSMVNGDANNSVGRRPITFGAVGSETNLTFGDTRYASSTKNGYAIPLYIYGVKL